MRGDIGSYADTRPPERGSNTVFAALLQHAQPGAAGGKTSQYAPTRYRNAADAGL